jgi:signal transduction histidine kinase
VPRLPFRHRVGLLVSLAAIALVAVAVVTLVLGRRSEQQLTGIETRYVPLIELDRDLSRIAGDMMKAIEDAAGAAEDAKLDEADRLEAAFLARLAAGRDSIVDNGADPEALVSAFQTYYRRARAVSASIIGGTPVQQLDAEIEAMRRERRELLEKLHFATSPDRTRLAEAFDTARDSQRESLVIDIVVACCALALMTVLSFRITRHIVRSLRAVSEGVERLASGDLAREIEVPAGDEIGDLAREANRTAARLRDYREQADRESRLAAEALVETRRQARAAEVANQELEAFSYSVSHDLRAPLRRIDGFSQALLEDDADRLSEKGKEHLGRIRGGAQRMAELIDDLLRLSRVSRGEFKKERVDLSAMVAAVIGEMRKATPDRAVEIVVQDGVTAVADPRLVRIMLDNLLGNAWKFTSKAEHARIEFGTRASDDGVVYFIKDNGAGFDMKYASRLFGAFQRLHAEKEFPGTGIGLATVQRIVVRHGGRIWVEASVGIGATFQFTLPS